MTAFHPIIQNWFEERYGEPTDIQSLSWPKIANRENLLITAPTGSGKTLTAFLWTLNRFVTGDLETGRTRVLYISPLKALNNDIRRNLLEPLAELKSRFDEATCDFPDVNVATRSGDTDQEQRRRMLRIPPEILITTPESLNLLLSSKGGRNLLYDIDTVILDEIHGVVDSKRGVYLMSAIERLVPLSGEFQRIALSATINPLERVADFVAGYTRDLAEYHKRDIQILTSTAQKQYDIQIRYPETAANRGEDEKVWDHLAEDLLPRIHQNQSTLVFVNSRALCEKLTFKINNAAGRTVAWAHHGSLSREIRSEVESRLKQGQLEAIVATSSLEMGIDIGALDEVILVQSPGSIASSIQRIGRAGHQVGVPSRCTIYPTHPRDFLEAAVLAQSVAEKALEPVDTISNPLDVLGQIIISMTGTERWDIDELFRELKRSTPYHHLSRPEFDLVINMLLGRYADHHIRELKPRVRIDRTSNSIEARKGALLSLYLSGGVIPDRGYFQLRHENGNSRIGELDEEFVWEARVGQVFSLGTQTWQVKKITHNDVIVGPGNAGSSAPPFWKAEPINRSFHYSSRINDFLEFANQRLDDEAGFKDYLMTNHAAEPRVADEIMTFLKRQKLHCRRDLPHRHHLLFEHIRSAPGRAAGHQLVIHTGWGARVNRPMAMALEAAWQRDQGEQPEVFVANESIVVQLPNPATAQSLLSMIPVDDLESLLRQRLEGSGFFGARFRENAGRSLLLSKGRFNERKPLWMSRLQSQKLMDSVLKYEDFPILLETWRTCLHDEFDMDNLRLMLAEIEAGLIKVSEVETATPSPFAQSVAWDQINTYMYMSDTPKSTKTSNLREDLLREVVFSPGLRPRIQPQLAGQFEAQRQRMSESWLPRDDDDLEDWAKERSLIPNDEWQRLIAALPFAPALQRFSEVTGEGMICAADDYPIYQDLFDQATPQDTHETFLANWLQYYGPLTMEQLESKLPLDAARLNNCLQSLVDTNVLIVGDLFEGSDAIYYCDAENYEYLLRIQRVNQRVSVEARPVEALIPFLYGWQTGQTLTDPIDQLYDCLDRLRGVPLPAALWETDVLPARLASYESEQLDLLFQEGELMWLGQGDKTVTFCQSGDIDLLMKPHHETSQLIPDAHARYEFNGLSDKSGLPAGELTERIWQEVWSGLITNDSVLALRRGLESDFKPPDIPSANRGSQRRAFNQWRSRSPLVGNWRRTPAADDALDILETQELEKERVRLLLARYGIVFRELCLREPATFEWRNLFRALRLMELSGEVISGHFFEGIPGPQFVTPASLRFFQENREDRVFFLNAADPISPSGLGLGIHGDKLPRRIASNYLVYRASTLVLTVAKRGRELQFHIAADDPSIGDYLAVLDHLNYRSFQPVRQLCVETINGQPVMTSPYLPALEARFNVIRDYKTITLQREI